ncbi:hypothetical protein N7519_005222 [Penicillium mononematosum]|uniref:uncharacterized protein n=1 Tax=Penicillium mononematosum TaxID=268346 RepID=UPI00254775FD|nr:uncharacterized protein N7519_005222 [Penicillium mononematosum]KAJ6183921.1 hypothetical protein N7519_005222 [Penicillium mononematosum]
MRRRNSDLEAGESHATERGDIANIINLSDLISLSIPESIAENSLPSLHVHLKDQADIQEHSANTATSGASTGTLENADAHSQEHDPNTTTPEAFTRTIEDAKPHIQEHNANTTISGAPIRSLEDAKTRQKELGKAKLSSLGFYDRLLNTGLPGLYWTSGTRNNKSYNIALSTLQRMVIHELQRKLVSNVKDIVRAHEVTEASMATAQDLLTQYTNAIRDYDFMTEKLTATDVIGERDPFLITTRDTLGKYVMKDASLTPRGMRLYAEDHNRYKRGLNILPGSSRNIHRRRSSASQLWNRLWMGLCGGLALIAPMLLMVLHKDQATTLATASIATMLFALGLAYLGTNLKGQEVLAGVSAYAAVLVVFVGTNS